MPGKISKFSKKSNAGYASNKKGAEFERRLEQGVLATGGQPIRIANGARRVGLPGPPYHRYIPERQPFDYIVAYDDKLIFLDCKTTSFKNIPYSSVHPAVNPNVRSIERNKSMKNQIRCLNILKRTAVCGFLYYFEQLNKIVFYDVQIMTDLKPKTSLKPDDGIFLGNISDFDLRILFQKADTNI